MYKNKEKQGTYSESTVSGRSIYIFSLYVRCLDIKHGLFVLLNNYINGVVTTNAVWHARPHH